MVRGWVRLLAGGEEPLRVESSGTARPGGRDGLSVGVVDEVSAGEDALEVGPGAAALGEHVALAVEADLVPDELRARVVTDGDEHAVQLALFHRAGLHVLDHRQWNQTAVLLQNFREDVETHPEIVCVEEAVARGVFGVPFYIVGDERFWGQDRLEDLDLHLSGKL